MQNKSRNKIPRNINWPCIIVAALERTSKALSTADISSFVRSVRSNFPSLFPLFLLPSCATLTQNSRAPLQFFVDLQIFFSQKISPSSLSFFWQRSTSSLARPRFHVANSGALYRDKSRTLTVWAFLAAEGGANKVKRGLKNVTLSVECGPLTVDAPPLSWEDPHPRGTPLAESLLARRI